MQVLPSPPRRPFGSECNQSDRWSKTAPVRSLLILKDATIEDRRGKTWALGPPKKQRNARREVGGERASNKPAGSCKVIVVYGRVQPVRLASAGELQDMCPIHGFALSRLQSHPCHYADIRQRKTHVAAVKRLKHNKVLKVLTQRIIGPSNS